MSNISGNGIPQINPEQMEEMLEILEGLSEKELKELADIGEKYIKKLEEEGIDPMEFLLNNSSWDTPGEEPAKEEIPALKPAPTDEPVSPKVITVIDKDKIEGVKRILEDIADRIGSLRQKAESKRELVEKLKSFEFALSDIIYFVLTIKEDHLIQYLFEKKFEPLYNILVELHQALETYEPQIYVTEFSLEGKDPYDILDVRRSDSFEIIHKRYQTISREKNPCSVKTRLKEQGKTENVIDKEMKKAHKRWDKIVWAWETLLAQNNSTYAFETILNIFYEMLYKQDIIAKFKELLNAYDPEALKMKEEQERKEEKAREEQDRLARQRPPWTQPVFVSSPSSAIDYYTDDNNAMSQRFDNGDRFDGEGYVSPDLSGEASRKEKKSQPVKDKTRRKKDTSKKNTKDKEKVEVPGLPSKEIDRKIFRVENKLDEIQKTLSEHEDLILDMKSYLTKPYEVSDKQTAIKVNQLFTSVSQEFTSLENTLQNDLTKFKDNEHNKKRYIKAVNKAYQSFKDDKNVKKSLEMLLDFNVKDNNITYNEKVLQTNSTKRFLVAGIPFSEGERSLLTAELQAINNLLVTRGTSAEDTSAINHIQTFKTAHDAIETLMKDTFG